MTKPSLIPFLLLLGALALAGCGGGGGGGSGNDTRGIDTGNTVYQAANGICSSASPEELKANYRTPSAEPDAIAEAIATNLAGGSEPDVEAARQGCLDGIEQYKAAQ